MCHSSDEVARELLSQSDIRAYVAETAGLLPDFQAAELRSRMATSPATRRAVNRFLHPLIGERNRSSEATFFEVPLLIEACLYHDYDQVWVVTCGLEEQVRRLEARYGQGAPISQILSLQLRSDIKCHFGDVVLRTNQPLEDVRQELRSTVCEIKPDPICSGS